MKVVIIARTPDTTAALTFDGTPLTLHLPEPDPACQPDDVIEQVNFSSLVLAARGQRATACAMLTAALDEVAAQNNFQDLLLIRRNRGHLLHGPGGLGCAA